LGLPGIGQPVPGEATMIVHAPVSGGLQLGAALLPGLYLAVAGSCCCRWPGSTGPWPSAAP